jgi:hypothetical protein
VSRPLRIQYPGAFYQTRPLKDQGHCVESEKRGHGLLISLVVVSLVVLWFGNSHAETVNYFYDELNRLKRVEYEDDLGTLVLKQLDKREGRI